MLNASVNAYVITNPGLVYLAFGLSFVLLIALLCYKDKSPLNMYLLTGWTFVEAYSIGVITAFYSKAGEGEIVLQAVGLTAAVFLALTLFTLQSKIDFSFLGGKYRIG